MAGALKRLTKAEPESVLGELKNMSELDANHVYLLHTDSYGYDAKNGWHWIVLLDLFPAKGTKENTTLALCADPMEDQLVVWIWESLLASKVNHAFRITRP